MKLLCLKTNIRVYREFRVGFNDNPRGKKVYGHACGVSDAQDSSRSAYHNPSQARRS